MDLKALVFVLFFSSVSTLRTFVSVETQTRQKTSEKTSSLRRQRYDVGSAGETGHEQRLRHCPQRI